ncbi:hypothetical protein Tco_0624318 [Tanacetum coccineum]|uniref:Uncharacterized protein n=1 Tax=Tanacetum coccineum TaxID=301880 RepID=A0ABQ4WDL0_9ASTR
MQLLVDIPLIRVVNSNGTRKRGEVKESKNRKEERKKEEKKQAEKKEKVEERKERRKKGRNETDEEDQISREASTKILQTESCISSLQIAIKRVNLVDFDFERQPSQMGPTVMGQTGRFVVGRSDPTNSRTGRRTWNLANELTLQSQPFDTRTVSLYTTSLGSQAAENVGLRNQHTYDYFHSDVTTSNSNMKRPLYREQLNKKHIDKKEMNHYEGIHGKHETIKPINEDLSPLAVEGSTSSSDSEGSLGEVYLGSRGSGDDEESASVMYSLSCQDHSPDMSSSTDSTEVQVNLQGQSQSLLGNRL